MAVNNFTIGQRVRVVRLRDWNGTPPDPILWRAILPHNRLGTVCRMEERDTVTVELDGGTFGRLQFLCNELEAIGVDKSSGGE